MVLKLSEFAALCAEWWEEGGKWYGVQGDDRECTRICKHYLSTLALYTKCCSDDQTCREGRKTLSTQFSIYSRYITEKVPG